MNQTPQLAHRKIYIFWLFFLVLGFTSCISTQKLYDNENYDAVISKVKKKISKGDAKREDVALAQKSMDKIDQKIFREIQALATSANLEDLDMAYGLYDKLISKYEDFEQVIRFDSGRKIELLDQQDWLKEDIIDGNMSEGLALLSISEEQKDKLAAQDAYYHFKQAEKYGSNYEDLDSLLDESFTQGIIKCFINENDVNANIHRITTFNHLGSGFVQMENGFACNDCDCEIRINVKFINYTENRFDESQSYSDKVQNGYSTQTDTAGVVQQIPNYVNISAEIRTQFHRKKAVLRANYNILQRTSNCNFSGGNNYFFEVESEGKTHIRSGDQRAIPTNLFLIDSQAETNYQMEAKLYEALNNVLRRDIRF